MFHPDKKPKSIWNLVLIFLLLYTATVMPYRIAFIEASFGEPWWYVSITVDILFGIDFFVNCFSAYYNSDGLLIISRR
jgi:uncharacterized membrane protein (DUF485 family)